MSEPLSLSTGAIIAGKLRVIRLIGEGGMGAVFEVEHTFTKHRRALKMLHGEYARMPDVVTRFLREASAAGRIGNRHVVETFDAGKLETGEPYIVMELLSGESLASLLERRLRLSVSEAVQILLQACEGVQAAHEAGIVHRDLKPENLFLEKEPRGFVKIVDFGISKFAADHTGIGSLTLEGSALGTPFYMPPEQVRGDKDVDLQADVYALGVVLYECVTGRKPFMAETLPHLSVLIHEGKYPPASEVVPGLPSALELVIGRALAVEKRDRFQSVREFAGNLRELDLGAGLALDDTIAVPNASFASSELQRDVARQPAVAAAVSAAADTGASATAASPRLGVTTHAGAAIEHTEPAARSRSSRGLFLALALGVVLVLIGGVLFAVRDRGPAPVTSAEPASPSELPQHAAPTPASPAVLPELAPPGSSVAPESSGSAPHVRHAAPSSRPAGEAVKKPPPAASSRAAAHGLGSENPF